MFGIGGFELFIILVFGFLIFGPEKLPEIARTVGKGIARFRQAQDEMNEVIKTTDIFDPNSDEPFKDPVEALDKLAKHQEEKQKDAARTAAAKAKAKASGASKPDVSDEASGTGAEEGAVQAPADAEQKPRQESFTERKARYERERAARKAAEEKAAAQKTADDSAGQADDAAGQADDAAGEAMEEHAPEAAETAAAEQPAREAASEGGDR